MKKNQKSSYLTAMSASILINLCNALCPSELYQCARTSGQKIDIVLYFYNETTLSRCPELVVSNIAVPFGNLSAR